LKIRAVSSSRALAACRPSLVGRGRFTVIGAAGPDPVGNTAGRVLLFNGRRGGKPVFYGHLYSPKPVDDSFLIVFGIRRLGNGDIVLEARMSGGAGDWGRFTGFDVALSRRFHHSSRPDSPEKAGRGDE
jgi:hypothetical protein